MNREDAEEVYGIVRQAMDSVDPSIESTECGSFRRGKNEAGDLDVVFTHPDPSKVKGLLRKVVEELEQTGHAVDVLMFGDNTSKDRSSERGRPRARGQDGVVNWIDPTTMGEANRGGGWDALDKAFLVLSQPSTSLPRQVDLVCTPPGNYPVAVVGWSGSTLFQRSLRNWAKLHGMHFASHGLFDRRTGDRIAVKDERDVFEKLGLAFVPPEMRNA